MNPLEFCEHSCYDIPQKKEGFIMHAFTYHSPTEIVFGKDTQLQLAEQIRKYGGNRVLLVYGSGSIARY